MNTGKMMGVILLGIAGYLWISADKNNYGTDIKSETTTATNNNTTKIKAEKEWEVFPFFFYFVNIYIIFHCKIKRELINS